MKKLLSCGVATLLLLLVKPPLVQSQEYIKDLTDGELFRILATGDLLENLKVFSKEELKRINQINNDLIGELVSFDINNSKGRTYQEIEAEVEANRPKALKEVEKIIGPDRMGMVILAVNKQLLANEVLRLNEPAKPLLLAPTLEKYLNISSQQKKRLSELSKRLSKQIEKQTDVFFEKLERLEKETKTKLYEVLTPKQRKSHEKFFGRPIKSRLFRESRLKTLISASNERYWKSSLGNKPTEQPVVEKPSNDYFWYRLVKFLTESEAYQDELELSKDQVAKLKDYFKSLSGRYFFADNKRAAKRLGRLLNNEYQVPDDFKKIMLPHQNKWLRHLECQLRLGPYRSSLGLLNDHVIRKLEIKPDKVKEIKMISVQSEKDVQKAAKDYQEELKKIRSGTRSKMTELLTDSQKKRYRKAVGDNGN